MISMGRCFLFLGVISVCGSAIGCGGKQKWGVAVDLDWACAGTCAGLREDWGRAGDCICRIGINQE
jgi:hypothetical protein